MTIKLKTTSMLLACLILALVGVYLKRNSPFGISFNLPFFAFIFSFLGLIGLLGFHLQTKKSWIYKIIGFIPSFLSTILIIFVCIGIYDYRVLLPMTKAKALTINAIESDLEYFESEIKNHPGFTPELKAQYDMDLAVIKSKAFKTSRNDYILQLTKLIGRFKDGHSFLPPFQYYNKSRYFPLAGHLFEDGFYILNAAAEYDEIVNRKLLEINDHPVGEIIDLLINSTGPENSLNFMSRINWYCFSENLLLSLNLIENDTPVTFTYLDDHLKPKEIRVKSAPFMNWVFWSFKPINNRIPVLNNLRTPNFVLHQYEDMLDLEFNLIEPTKDMSIEELANQMDSVLSTNTIRTLLIDLRNNTGGNNQLYQTIIDVIQKYPDINQPNHFFVLTSRITFSAGINFLDDLNFKTSGTIIGEPSGAGPNHFGDARIVRLPQTGVFFFLSTKKWIGNDPSDTLKTILPDVPVKYFFSDYATTHDPWMQAIDSINLIRF